MAFTPDHSSMAKFDALPPRLRRAVAAADFPHDVNWIAAWLAHGVRAERILRQIMGKPKKDARS